MTTNRYCRGIAVSIAALILASAAHASSIAIFNTGVDANGTTLPNGSLGETHYSLISVPGLTTGLRVLTSAGGFPVGPWVGDSSISAWIGPNNSAQADGPAGDYIYRTTFDLTGLNPDTAALTGQWSKDDKGIDILINGISTGQTGTDFTAFTSFSISSGFVAGINNLDFMVHNIDNASTANPTGLRVEVTGTANAPEPASLALFGAGFAGLFLLRRRLGWAGKLQ